MCIHKGTPSLWEKNVSGPLMTAVMGFLLSNSQFCAYKYEYTIDDQWSDRGSDALQQLWRVIQSNQDDFFQCGYPDLQPLVTDAVCKPKNKIVN